MSISLADKLGIEIPRWHDDAECQNYPPEWFVSEEGSRNTFLISKGKQVCINACEVREQCLNWALQIEVHRECPGTYGGTTQHERRGMRICRYEPCNNTTTKLNTGTKTKNVFCSEECRYKHKLALSSKNKKKNRDSLSDDERRDYYMRGVLHYG